MSRREPSVEILINSRGLYIIDFVQMRQIQKNDPTKYRRIRYGADTQSKKSSRQKAPKRILLKFWKKILKKNLVEGEIAGNLFTDQNGTLSAQTSLGIFPVSVINLDKGPIHFLTINDLGYKLIPNQNTIVTETVSSPIYQNPTPSFQPVNSLPPQTTIINSPTNTHVIKNYNEPSEKYYPPYQTPVQTIYPSIPNQTSSITPPLGYPPGYNDPNLQQIQMPDSPVMRK